MIRRNGDQGERELERRFVAGDRQAGLELARRLLGSGQLTLQRAMFLGDVVPEAISAMDPRLAYGLGFLFAGGEHGTRGAYERMISDHGSAHSQFFPDHSSTEVCPRGHRLEGDGEGVDWLTSEMEHLSREVVGRSLEGVLQIEGLPEHHDAPVTGTYLSCLTPIGSGSQRRTCDSTWLIYGDDYEYVY